MFTSTSTASPAGTITAYTWNFGTGATPAAASTVGPHTVSYSSTGTRTVALTITDSNGCSATVSQDVMVNPMVTVTAAAIPTTICNGQANTTLNANPSGGAGFTYAWSNGAGTSQSVVVSPTTNTTYTVTVTNSNGCTGTANVSVNVNNLPSVSLSSTATNGVNIACFGGSTGSITTSVSGGAPFSYNWSGPTTIPVNTANPSGLSVGTYRVTVTNANGCTATSSIVLTQPAQPLNAGTCTVLDDRCQVGQGQVRIQAQGGTLPYTVSWTPSHGTPNSPQFIATNGGSVLISGLRGNVGYTFIVNDANGCQAP